MQDRLFHCRWLLRGPGRVESDGVLWVRGGTIAAVASGSAGARLAASVPAAARARPVEVDGLLAPGLVDAHAHLDLSALAGRLAATDDFVAWVKSLLAARAAIAPEEHSRAIGEGARALLASGTTTAGDVDSLGLADAALAASPLRRVSFVEVLDGADPERTEAAYERALRALRAPAPVEVDAPRTDPYARGLSPHAPHTVSRALLKRLGGLRGERPVQAHWAETEAEVEWLASGTGAFAPLLRASPRASGLELLAASGLLDGASLVHGNHPSRGEPELLARSGCSVVHCPGTHAYFRRAPFPWRAYRSAGVPIALGTDSLASNDRLDMRVEMAAARRAFPDSAPSEVLAAATVAGAAALGLEGSLGRLEPGYLADLVHVRVGAPSRRESARSPERLVDAWTADVPPVEAVWVGGALAVGARSD